MMNRCQSIRRLALVVLALSACLLASLRATAQTKPDFTPVRIALVSDVHIAEGTNENARLHPLRMARVIEDVNAAKVDLVLLAGDLTENGTPLELRTFRRTIKDFAAPSMFIAGNHDLGNKRIPGKKPTKSEISFGRLRNYELEMGRSYWTREAGGLRIIGLNSGLYGSKLAREESMWEMLESELEKTNTPPTLILQHHPPFLKKLDEPGGDYFNMEPYPRLRLLALAKQGGVKAILSGHLHRGLTNDYNGILLYTTPPVSFGLPKGKQAEGWTLVTVTAKEVQTEFRPIPSIKLPVAVTSSSKTNTAQRQ